MPQVLPLAMSALALVASLSPTLPAQSSDYRKARSKFVAASRQDDLETRLAAIDALAATGESKASRLLFGELEKLERPLLRKNRALEAIGKKRKEIWDSIDKQAGKGRAVTMGTAGKAIEKERELTEQERELLEERNRLFRWRDHLIEGIAALLENMEQPASLLNDIATEAERARDVEEALPRVEVLAAFGGETARATLAGLVGTSEHAEVRVAAIDALGRLRSPASTGTLTEALDDPSWTVRVAAARALARLHSLEMVPALVDRIEKYEGRTREEIVESLEDLTGHRAADNAQLWKDWWAQEGEELRGILSDLDAENLATRLRAISAVGRTGLLVGASKLLAMTGLGLDADEPEFTDEAQRKLAADAIGQAITKAPREIRERAVLRLLIARLVQQREPERRVAFLEQLGRVRTAKARDRLIAYASELPVRKPGGSGEFDEEARAAMRLAAVRGLGNQGSKKVVPPLEKVVKDFEASTELKRAAIESLGSNTVKESVPALLTALREDDEDLRQLARDQLAKLTGQSFEAEYVPWRDWWREAESDFTPRGEVATADEREEKEKRRTGFYGIETDSTHIMYIIDRSNSMNEPDAESGSSRWSTAEEELVSSIRSLPDGATFNVVFYNHEFDAWKRGMVEASSRTRSAAIRWIEGLQPAGNTNIFDPLAFALEQARVGQREGYGDPVDTLFFLSDGQPNRGNIVVPAEILKEIERINERLKVRIHTVGIGDGHDAVFMRRLAESSGGTYVGR